MKVLWGVGLWGKGEKARSSQLRAAQWQCQLSLFFFPFSLLDPKVSWPALRNLSRCPSSGTPSSAPYRKGRLRTRVARHRAQGKQAVRPVRPLPPARATAQTTKITANNKGGENLLQNARAIVHQTGTLSPSLLRNLRLHTPRRIHRRGRASPYTPSTRTEVDAFLDPCKTNFSSPSRKIAKGRTRAGRTPLPVDPKSPSRFPTHTPHTSRQSSHLSCSPRDRKSVV